MRRRSFLLAAKCEQPVAPGDAEKLNRFVGEYNDYVMKLANGILDLENWQRVVRAWERLQ